MKIDLSEDLGLLKKIEFDDYPDQESEYRVARAVELGRDAVWDIATKLINTPEEEFIVHFRVAINLLEQLGSKLSADVLHIRLANRFCKK